jgi:trigger factor
MTMDAYLEGSGQTARQLEDDFEQDARRSVKAGFILDKLAMDEELGVETDELNAYVTEQAYRIGVPPAQLAEQLTEQNQLSSVVADVLRSKALSLVTERANVTDETGRTVDIAAAYGRSDEDAEDDSEDEPDTEPDTDSDTGA